MGNKQGVNLPNRYLSMSQNAFIECNQRPSYSFMKIKKASQESPSRSSLAFFVSTMPSLQLLPDLSWGPREWCCTTRDHFQTFWQVINTVPMDQASEDMFVYFEPLYEVIHDMPRPPESFFKKKSGMLVDSKSALRGRHWDTFTSSCDQIPIPFTLQDPQPKLIVYFAP